jgi:single-stranded-DNA-specific exonuclease
MHWKIYHKLKSKRKTKRIEEIERNLLDIRKIRSKKEREEFFNPKPPISISPEQIDLSQIQIKKTLKKIELAIKKKELIIIYGDYDADGICATALLWEILHLIGANVLPFIPHREKHGYGLSMKGIDQIINAYHEPVIIFTVDNGIVAFEAVDYANKKNIDVIICDHHQKAKKLPKSFSILHSTKVAGAGLAWIIGKIILKHYSKDNYAADTLDLATIGSVADMVPLIGPNRSIVKHGIEQLQKSKRKGIIELCKSASVDQNGIDTYHINFLLAPRINAMGRLDDALDSLRLLCTKNNEKAIRLAEKLSLTNRKRQEMTDEAVEYAKQLVLKENNEASMIIIENEEFHEGIIGLIAGKLVEEFSKPVVVIAKRESLSKASARSIEGTNIIEMIRKTSDILIDVGGHPLAAGFTVKTDKIDLLKKKLFLFSDRYVKKENIHKQITIDCEIDLADINWNLYHTLQKFKPYGVANPQPTFCFTGIVREKKLLGINKQHLKILLTKENKIIPIIFFQKGYLFNQIDISSEVKVVGSLNLNSWNGDEEIQIHGIDLKFINL